MAQLLVVSSHDIVDRPRAACSTLRMTIPPVTCDLLRARKLAAVAITGPKLRAVLR